MLRNYSYNYTIPETLQTPYVIILLLNRYFTCYNFKNNNKTKTTNYQKNFLLRNLFYFLKLFQTDLYKMTPKFFGHKFNFVHFVLYYVYCTT